MGPLLLDDGSGLVLDVDRRLVVTTSGVMTNLDKVIVDVPVLDGEEVVVEAGDYFKNTSPAFATVLYRDPQRNLAMVPVETKPQQREKWANLN